MVLLKKEVNNPYEDSISISNASLLVLSIRELKKLMCEWPSKGDGDMDFASYLVFFFLRMRRMRHLAQDNANYPWASITFKFVFVDATSEPGHDNHWRIYFPTSVCKDFYKGPHFACFFPMSSFREYILTSVSTQNKSQWQLHWFKFPYLNRPKQ